ncbi:aspartic peptidase domain-containing protein [Plectosphaerella plurivora]|uniref:Aspartic peptidase domain-containing protein n=1 Tax=Plectosphaerella plurivora TaxID=936078 RepID=A0A9P9AEA2_9PEZI|nr:aspartic peptidase domain-containing protein [Plectosphaerella plurivora]
MISISLGALHVWALGVEAAGGFISLPLTRHTIASAPSQAFVKRQTDTSLSVAHNRDHYLIDVDVGTPKQRVQLAVDVIGSGLTVMGTCDTPRYSFSSECRKTGAYNASASTTGMFVAGDGYDFDEEDTDMSFARFNYYADDVTIAGLGTLKNKTFRAWNSSEGYTHGYLGLGFSQNSTEPSILDNLVAEGLIGAPAFGVTLDGGIDSGSLVLGGVNTKKFSGPLTKVPVVDAPEGVEDWERNKYWINIDGVAVDNENGTRSSWDGFKAEIQTAYAYSTIPFHMFMAAAEGMGVHNWSDPNWDIIPCSRRDTVNGSLDLQISGFTASIPYADLIIPYEVPGAKEGDCYIALSEGQYYEEFPVWSLGTVFLNSVYTVFDQGSKAVWMAKHIDCGSEPVAFTKGDEIRGQCDGAGSSGESGSSGGGTPDNDDGSGGSRMAVDMVLILGAVLASLAV